MEHLLRLLPGPQPILVRYGAAAAAVLVTFALRAGIEHGAGTYGFILFIPAIVGSALLFDRGTGFFALALSAGLIAAALEWRGHLGMHVAALASFLIVGGALVLISEGLHRALERAYRAEREKDLLLQEMSHRVKNKFAMISSLIGLQSRQASSETRAVLEALDRRVRVIANVHDYLQLSRHGGLVDMREYLSGLCRSLDETVRELRPVVLSMRADEVDLPPEKALAVGLVINELVTNAFKYAFPDDKVGNVRIELRRKGEDKLELSVADDGIGCAEKAEGLGRRLVTLLMAQLGGKLDWEATSPGCRVSGTFPPR
jgi:two-component sensor histidine kinase